MGEIFKIIGAVIAGLGGSSIIILGLSSWLGKVWANRIFEKEKLKYEKELQDYKGAIDKEMQRLKTLDEKALYTTRIQYEKEFEIYQNIWKILVELVWAAKNLYPIDGRRFPEDEDDASIEEYKKKYSLYNKKFNNFLNVITFNAPFYQEEFYNDLNELRGKCFQFGLDYNIYNIGIKYSFASDLERKMCKEDRIALNNLPNEIDEINNKLLRGIRDYLKRIRAE